MHEYHYRQPLKPLVVVKLLEKPACGKVQLVTTEDQNQSWMEPDTMLPHPAT
jgi:hypothetical protein